MLISKAGEAKTKKVTDDWYPFGKQIVMNLIPMALATMRRMEGTYSEGASVQEYHTREEKVDIPGDSSGGMDQDPSG